MRHEPASTFDVGIPKQRRPSRSIAPEAIPIAALTIFSAFTLWGIPLCHDVVYQFWLARQMLGGTRLYTDIIELNPPLWFWSAVPIQYMGEVTGIAPLRLLIAAIAAMGGVSSFLLSRCLEEWPLSRRLFIATLAFGVGVLLPLYDFGQREQLALIATVPYAALIARRHEGLRTSPTLSIAIALLASYGFALKHYFCAGAILLEGGLAISLRRSWRAVRPETITLASAAIIYGAAILLFALPYLRDMVPIIRLAYFGYQVPLSQMFAAPTQLMWCLALLSLALYGGLTRPRERLTTAMLLLGGGFFFAYLVQGTNPHYHTVPVTGALLLAVGVQVSEIGIGSIARYPFGILTGLFAIQIAVWNGPYRNLLREGSDPLLATVSAGSVVTMWVSDPSWTWPMIEDRRLVWTSAYPTLWMLPAIAHEEIYGPPDPRLEALGKSVRARVAKEMLCNPPELILSERRLPFRDAFRPPQFDTTAFFLRDLRIRELVRAHYRQEHSTEWFDIFRRYSPVAPPRGIRCLTPR